jgi:excisionase family DNA binding protein
VSKSTVQFSPKQVAQSLRVSESSVKRWCDQGAIPTIRTVGGHRRITLSGLNEFLQATERTLADPAALGIDTKTSEASGEALSGSGKVLGDSKSLGLDSKTLTAAGPPPVRRRAVPGDGNEPIQQHFRTALAAGDEQTCIELLEARIAQGWNRAEAAEDLITDAMRALGDAWDCGDLEVYQERRSCTICSRLIYRLRENLPDLPDSAPTAVGAAPESDPYQLPTALVELALREVGWNAINLGCNLPLDSLIQAINDYQPKLVWLSVTHVSDPSRFIREQNKLANSLGDGVSLIVGGRCLDDRLRPKLKYTAHCDSLRHLTELSSILRQRG